MVNVEQHQLCHVFAEFFIEQRIIYRPSVLPQPPERDTLEDHTGIGGRKSISILWLPLKMPAPRTEISQSQVATFNRCKTFQSGSSDFNTLIWTNKNNGLPEHTFEIRRRGSSARRFGEFACAILVQFSRWCLHGSGCATRKVLREFVEPLLELVVEGCTIGIAITLRILQQPP